MGRMKARMAVPIFPEVRSVLFADKWIAAFYVYLTRILYRKMADASIENCRFCFLMRETYLFSSSLRSASRAADLPARRCARSEARRRPPPREGTRAPPPGRTGRPSGSCRARSRAFGRAGAGKPAKAGLVLPTELCYYIMLGYTDTVCKHRCPRRRRGVRFKEEQPCIRTHPFRSGSP